MRSLALTVVALSLALAAPALADDASRVARFLPVAEAQWPGSPCNGHEEIVTDGAAVTDISAYYPLGSGGLAVAGMATGCKIDIAPGLGDYAFCVTLTHELGHAAGYGHSADPHNVMYYAIIPDYAPCLTAAMPPYLPGRPQIRRRHHHHHRTAARSHA